MDRPSASPSATPRSSLPRDRDASIHDPSIRLSTPVSSRLILGFVSSGTVGFVLGALHGGQIAQLRFRAEHAHKMPDTTTGWYLYHKSKNYHAMRGGISEGFRMASRTSLWTIVALGLESSVDRYRGCSDMFSTTVATLTVAGAFSLWRKYDFFFNFPVPGKTAIGFTCHFPLSRRRRVGSCILYSGILSRLSKLCRRIPCVQLSNSPCTTLFLVWLTKHGKCRVFYYVSKGPPPSHTMWRNDADFGHVNQIAFPCHHSVAQPKWAYILGSSTVECRTWQPWPAAGRSGTSRSSDIASDMRWAALHQVTQAMTLTTNTSHKTSLPQAAKPTHETQD